MATKRALTRDRILRAALAIVDRDGLDAISMRRLGEELGVEAMSLYHHVASKAAILDGIFEILLAELPAAPRASSWQAALRARAKALRAVLRAHPHALPIFATRPAVTPAAIAHVEAVLDVLRTAGFSVGDALSALQVLFAFVVGHSISSYAGADAAPAYAALDPAAFPRTLEIAGLRGHDVEREFELGLTAMLTGLAARI